MRNKYFFLFWLFDTVKKIKDFKARQAKIPIYIVVGFHNRLILC